MTLIAHRTVGFRLNGRDVSVRADHPHLLSALREELDITSAKDGCAPSGQCGCCTVLVNGRAFVACVLALEKVAGKEVVTLEGFDPVQRDRLASAFAASGALQCGFCTPGILVRTKALIDLKGSRLTKRVTAGRLGAHLCRCTGYTKIFDAIDMLARGEIPPLETSGGIGKSGIKYEGYELALGDRDYIDDIRFDGILHGALRLTDHARADILRIDTGPAEAIPGVHAVFTAADVAGELRVGLIHKDWPVLIPEGGRTSYYGDVLAIVVSDDRLTARQAAEAIEVEYRVLKPFTDPAEAVASEEDAVWGLDGNVLSVSKYTRGDFEAAYRDAPHKVHETFITQRVEHAFLEPESTLVVPV